MTMQGWARFGVVLVSLALMMALAVDVALGQQPPAFGTLRGRVVDAVTGDPVPRARLRLTAYGMTAVADDLGVYVFTGVPAGATTLIASAPGYRDYVQNIEIFGGQQTLDVLLTPAGAPPSGPPPATAPVQPGPRVAPPPARGESGFGLYLAGGMAQVGMKDFNDKIIGPLNDLLRFASLFGSVKLMERIESGPFGEVGLRLGTSPFQVLLSGVYLKLSDSRGSFSTGMPGYVDCSFEPGVCYKLIDGEASSEMIISPSVIGGAARLMVSPVQGPVRLLLGGGLLYYQATISGEFKSRLRGSVEVHVGGSEDLAVVDRQRTESNQVTGSTIGYEGAVQLGLSLGERMELRGGLSYVSATIRELRDKDGREIRDFDGRLITMDLSGLRYYAVLAIGF